MADNAALKALLLAKQRGQLPEQVDGGGNLQQVLQPGLNSLQAQRDKIIKDKLQREGALEQYGGRAPIAEGEIRSAPGVAPVQQTMGGQYDAAMRMKMSAGDYPGGAVGDALRQVEEKNIQDPTAREEKFKQILQFMNSQMK